MNLIYITALREYTDLSFGILAYFAAMYLQHQYSHIMRRVSFGRPKETKKALKVCLENPRPLHGSRYLLCSLCDFSAPIFLLRCKGRFCVQLYCGTANLLHFCILVSLMPFIKPKHSSRLKRLRRVAPGPMIPLCALMRVEIKYAILFIVFIIKYVQAF